MSEERERRDREKTDLERLGIPILDFLDGRHFAEIVREFIEFFDSVCKPDWQFFCWKG